MVLHRNVRRPEKRHAKDEFSSLFCSIVRVKEKKVIWHLVVMALTKAGMQFRSSVSCAFRLLQRLEMAASRSFSNEDSDALNVGK
jgi:hypothetical protein